jgi:hypothetical protein
VLLIQFFRRVIFFQFSESVGGEAGDDCFALLSLLWQTLKRTVSQDFLLLVFFTNQFPPSPGVFYLDRFKFF